MIDNEKNKDSFEYGSLSFKEMCRILTATMMTRLTS